MSPKYLFFTYGAEGWRGVQIRGIRVAQYFEKGEVIFWNGNDKGEIIKKAGFQVESVDLSLIHPDEIRLPKSIETVVFADIPTNEFFQFSLFVKAKKEGKKVIIFDQIYRRGQTNEFVYKKLAEESDAFFLNGLSFLKSEEKGNFKIIPPLIEIDLPENPKQYLAKKYDLPDDKPWLLGIGYHEEVKQKIEQLGKILYNQGVDFHIIYTGELKDKKAISPFSTQLPYSLGDDFFYFIKASEIALIKFGFLQLIETIALGAHPIILGGGGYLLQKKHVMDEKIWEAVYYSEEIDKNLQEHIRKFLADKEYRKKYKAILENLHNGELKGGKIAADYIKGLKQKGKGKAKKKNLALFINDEFLKFEEFVKKHQGELYPVVIICSAPKEPFIIKRPNEDLLSSPIDTLITKYNEVLPHSFKEVYVLARRKYDSFLEIMPWYEEWIEKLKNTLEKAQKIYITHKGISMLKQLINNHIDKVEVLD